MDDLLVLLIILGVFFILILVWFFFSMEEALPAPKRCSHHIWDDNMVCKVCMFDPILEAKLEAWSNPKED